MIERDNMSEKEIRDWYVSKHGLEANDDGTQDYFVHKAFLKAWDEKRPHGRWVWKFDENTGISGMHCSACGFAEAQVYNKFCGQCGADMRVKMWKQ